MPKLAPFTVDALVYAVGSASDILGFSALFEAKAAALLIIILFILLAAMLGAIIQATKSMEVGTPNFKNLEVYTETDAVAKGFTPRCRGTCPAQFYRGVHCVRGDFWLLLHVGLLPYYYCLF
jgi:hypothetical protein